MGLIDFDWDEGFAQAAGKKKKKVTTTFNWAADDDKKDDGAGEDADGNRKDQNSGEAGGSGSTGDDGGDDKKEDDKKEDDKKEDDKKEDDQKEDDQKDAADGGNDDDIWDFAPASSKKKKNKAKSSDATDAFGLPDIPSADFHEIRLDDTGGGQQDDPLDLGLLPKAEKITSGITAWTSSWTTGSWGWGGLKSPDGSEMRKPAEEETSASANPIQDNNPWSINRGKPKKTDSGAFSFGALDGGEEKKKDSFDFMGSIKPVGKKDTGTTFSWGAAPAKTVGDDFWGTIVNKKPKEEEQPAGEDASDDIWGFSSSKKDKKQKNNIAVVEETSVSADQPAEFAPPGSVDQSPVDSAAREAEAAMIAEEEAELRKLQTKKDIGSKLTKKQQDRLKVLTENSKAREEAARAAAETNQADSAPVVDSLDPSPSDETVPLENGDTSQAEADEQALIIQEEEDEMYILRSKKRPSKSDKNRLRVLEERADDRAREAKEAAAMNEQHVIVPEVVDVAELLDEEPLVEPVDDAQFEADEKARIIREEEDELAALRAKKKPKKSDKDRIRLLEERADERAREAKDAAAAAVDPSVPESSGDATESKNDETAPTSVDDDTMDNVDKDDAAQLIEEEEIELEMLLSKMKPKKADKTRIKELQENKARREEQALEKAAIEPALLDDMTAATEELVQDAPKGEVDLEARIAEEEELELELLLSKPKLKKPDKARLKVLQDNKAQREWDAAEKAQMEFEAPQEERPAVEEAPSAPAQESDPVDETAVQEGIEDAEIAAEESELAALLSKPKLKKPDKQRLKELQDRKDQREREAAEKQATRAPPAEDSPVAEEAPVVTELDPVDEAALEKEKADALVAAEENELLDLLSKAKPKKSDKARIMDLQDRKDARDAEARLAAEKVEQEVRALEDQQKREAEEKAAAEAAAEIAAEEAEITSLESKKKLRKSEKDRLAELKFRRDERASAEAAKLADELMKEDAKNGEDAGTKESFSWADDDPAAKGNGGDDDWMDWGGLSSSSKSKKNAKEEPVPDPPAADPESQNAKVDDGCEALGISKKDQKKTKEASVLPEAPGSVRVASGFDFGWGKPTTKEEPADDIWGFGSSSKKKKPKNAPAEIIEDTNLASTSMTDPLSATKDKDDNDFWSTFGTNKATNKQPDSSKDDLVAEIPFPIPSPVGLDLTRTEEGDVAAGSVWGDLSGSTELSKSKSSDKESKKSSSSKEPKLSKKELEKLDKEKRKAEKEQKAREEQEAKDAAELARLEEEERIEAEANAEQERLAQEEADLMRKEEEEKQAALDAIAKEESDLAALQVKKDSGKKLLKKEKERYDKLFASCQARADEKAAQEAAEQAARDEAERLQREAEEQAAKEAIEKEEAELKDLQKRKDSGRKLLKKDKERYEGLTANKKARRQAELEAEAEAKAAAIQDGAAPDGDEFVDPLEKDLAQLDGKELDELDAFLSAPLKPTPAKGAPAVRGDVDAFSFWGASKKPTNSSNKKDKSLSAAESVSYTCISKYLSGTPSFQPIPIHLPSPLPRPLPPFHTPPSRPQQAHDVTSHLHQYPTIPNPPLLLLAAFQPAASEIAHAESSSFYKLLDAATSRVSSGSKDKTKHDAAVTAGVSSSPLLPQSAVAEQHDNSPPPAAVAATAPTTKTKTGVGKSKIADRLKAFEPVPSPEHLLPPPPPPPPPPVPVAPPAHDAKKSKRNSIKVDIPGSFPDELEEGHPDDIIEVIEMPVRTKKSSKKSSSKVKADDTPVPIPPPPPAVPDVPIPPPPPEVKKESKKERPKINRDGGSSWGTWTASTTRDKEKKPSSKSKSAEEPKKPRKEERSPEKEERLSVKGYSSDKAERTEKDKDVDMPRPKLKSVFASTPPISRSVPTRDKRHKEGRSSRRPSMDVNSGMVSPPPEDMLDIGSKAAKILGISAGLSRRGSLSKRKNSARPVDEEEAVMVGATEAESPEKASSRRRTSKSYHRDEDIVMVDAADTTPAPLPPPPPPGLKRANTTGSTTRKGFGGLFGGILSNSRPEPKRRNTYHTDGEEPATDAEAEARKAARRARRVEREVGEKPRDEVRRDKRHKQEAEAEAQRQAEKEARRAERRAARIEREAALRNAVVDEDKEERSRRRKQQREKDREALETDDAEAEEARRARRERRKARESDHDEDRRRRRDKDKEKRSPPTRRRTEPVSEDGGDYVYSRPAAAKISRRHTDGPDAPAKAAEGVPAWPHSGTSSWVKDHSDAGPPPDDGGGEGGPAAEAPDEGDEDAARRERRRRRRGVGVDGGETDGGAERRRKRHEERSEGSDERRRGERKASLFADGGGGGGRGRGGFGGLWKKLTRY